MIDLPQANDGDDVSRPQKEKGKKKTSLILPAWILNRLAVLKTLKRKVVLHHVFLIVDFQCENGSEDRFLRDRGTSS